MSRKRKSPSSAAVVLLMGMGAMGLVALGAYVRMTPADKVPPSMHRREETQRSTPVVESRRHGESSERVQGRGDRVLVPVVHGDKVRLATVEAKGDPKLYVAERTFTALKVTDARIKSVSVAGGVARVDIEGELPLSIGSEEEGTLLKAMQMSLGQFPDVEQIQFQNGGQPVESLGGHIEASDPIPVIRPGQSDDSTPSASSNQP